ncbi:hypothetical protein GCM10029978_015480 [Actinoallomurus acanthiterrae]
MRVIVVSSWYEARAERRAELRSGLSSSRYSSRQATARPIAPPHRLARSSGVHTDEGVRTRVPDVEALPELVPAEPPALF